MMNTLPVHRKSLKKLTNTKKEKASSLSPHLTQEEILHHATIEEIQMSIHPSIRVLINQYSPPLIAEALEWYCDRLRESKNGLRK